MVMEMTGEDTYKNIIEKIETIKNKEKIKLQDMNDILYDFSEFLEKERITMPITIEDIEFRWAGSRHGRWIHPFVEGNMVTAKKENLETSFYYHGDFNAHYSYITREQAKWLVENAQKILNGLIEKVKEIQKENELLF